MKKTRALGISLITLSSIIRGGLAIVVRLSQGVSAAHLAFFRVLIAAICLYLFAKVARKKEFQIQRVEEKRLQLLLFGFLHAAAIVFYFITIQLVDIATAVLLLNTSAFWMALFSWTWLKDKVKGGTIVSLALSALGLVLILFPGGIHASGEPIGYLVGILSGITAALVFITSGRFIRQTFNGISKSFYQNLISIPLLFPFLLSGNPVLTLRNVVIFIILGVFFTALTFVLVYTGQMMLPEEDQQKLGIFQSITIVVSTILAFLFFGEVPSTITVVGGLLITVSLGIAAL